MEVDQSKLSPPRTGRYFPYFVLVVGLLTTLFFSYYIWRNGEARDQARFTTTTQELTTYVRGRPRLYIEVLRATTGLFAVDPALNPRQFRIFIDRLELANQYPGAQGIGFLEQVKRENKDSFIATMQKRGLKNFAIQPEQNQDAYFPVVYF